MPPATGITNNIRLIPTGLGVQYRDEKDSQGTHPFHPLLPQANNIHAEGTSPLYQAEADHMVFSLMLDVSEIGH